MKTRFLLVPLLIAAVAALAGCGGGGPKTVPSDAVAMVGNVPITQTDFKNLIAQAEGQAIAAGQEPPKIGTPQYTTLRDNVVGYLVQVSELSQEAAKRGVKVTAGDINAYLKSVAKLHYDGSQKKLVAAIQKSGLTLAQAKYQVMVNLLEQKLKTKVTSAAKVTTAQEQQYYNSNKATYQHAESRDVRHILVATKSLAETLEAKLKNGASFAALAKKYSKDTGSGAKGGSLGTITKGEMVAPFDKVAFSIKTNVISPPVHSQFGWHIIEATSPIKPAYTQTFKQVQSTIKTNLLQQQQQTVWGTFVTNLQKSYAGKISYQVGYVPATTATTTAPPTTTG